MSQEFQSGDFLVFQIESGFGLLRVLDITKTENNETIWHLSAYKELFPDIEFAETSIETGLSINIPHVALTERAFLSTQVSKLENKPLSTEELKSYELWKSESQSEISDRSIRLMLGLR